MTDSATHLADRARNAVLDSHRETVETVLGRADAVAAAWDGDSTADRSEVAEPLRRELNAVGEWQTLPEVLTDAVAATGESLSAPPVAGPPYVAATSRGPMLRATLAEGRLVVLLRAFEVERDPDGAARYRRGPTTPEEAVRTAFE